MYTANMFPVLKAYKFLLTLFVVSQISDGIKLPTE